MYGKKGNTRFPAISTQLLLLVLSDIYSRKKKRKSLGYLQNEFYI